MSDIEVINLELVLSDMEIVSKRLVNLAKDAKRGDKEAIAEDAVLKKMASILEAGKMATEAQLPKEEKLKIKSLNLLTLKPMLYVLNTSEANNNVEVDVPGASVKIDSIFEKGFDDLIKASYKLLGLETFLTTGEDETRAWTMKIGSTAPEAGQAIHTELKDKFIRAEVIAYEKLMESGSRAVAREKGLLHIEGKEYIVKDGDVIEFLI